jgi:hypothetical protein
MAYRKPRGKTDLDVTGFLSIMSIVTGLICLILFVIALRIALNPDLVKIVSFKLFTSIRSQPSNPKSPSYVDCHPGDNPDNPYVVLYPGGTKVTWTELQKPNNEFEKMLAKIQERSAKEYIIVMVRPGSVKAYRQVRKMIGKRPIDVGYDAIDADFKIDWAAAEAAAGIKHEEQK